MAITKVTNAVLSSGSTLSILDGKSFLDEDNMASNSATGIASQQSIKAYVDSQVTAQDLDFQGDSGGALSIDLDSESLTIAGGTGLATVGSGNTVTVNIDATVATLTGSQTLTNKTIDVDNNTVSNIEVDNFKASAIVLESEGIGSNDNDTSLPTSAAVKDYVDTQITAEDLDITTDSGTIAIDLDSETLTVSGGTGLDSSATGNAVTLAIDSTVTTLTGTQTLTNKTLTNPVISTIVSTSNGAINLDPNGSGVVVFKGNATKGAGQFKLNCENNSHGITIKGPPHSAGASYTLTLPNNDGDANQFLQTNGSGVLTWATASGGGSTTLLGLTDVGSDGTNGQVLTTNGSGSFTFTTVSGGGGGSTLSGGTSIYMNNAWSDQNIGRNVVTQLNFDTVVFGNAGTPFSTTNHNYTVPSAGKYLFLGQVNSANFVTGSNAQQALYVYIYKNGSSLQYDEVYEKSQSTDTIRYKSMFNYVIDLAQNDVIDFRARLSNFAGSTTLDIGRGEQKTFMYIVKIES